LTRRPDLFVIGKSIGGGLPCGAYGITEDVARLVGGHPEADLLDDGPACSTWSG
jgi:glutamate-1-semialdehyde 2,1-aminomutase